jgi:hypothetical protein
MALKDDIAAAKERITYIQKRLATDRREARLYDSDALQYPAALVNSIDNHEKELKKAERALAKLGGTKSGVGAKSVRTREELEKEIGHTRARIKELETEILNNDRYQETMDEHYISRQIGYLDFHEPKLKKLERALREFDKRKTNPMAKKKAKRKKKRKATPAQLRALAKGRATAARNRKTKAPKRKKVTARRRNPAYGNYQTARAVARGSRRVNPVRPPGLEQWFPAPALFFVMRGARYFTGYSFSKERRLAVHYTSVGAAKAAAQKLADKTGSNIRIIDARK